MPGRAGMPDKPRRKTGRLYAGQGRVPQVRDRSGKGGVSRMPDKPRRKTGRLSPVPAVLLCPLGYRRRFIIPEGRGEMPARHGPAMRDSRYEGGVSEKAPEPAQNTMSL